MAELIFKIDEFRATSKPETFEIKTSDVKVIEKDNKLFYSGEGLIFDELKVRFEFEYELEIDKIKECDVLIDGKHTFKLIDIRKDIENIYLENYKKPVHQIIIYVLTCQNK